jgi:type VI secretion system protein ImpH
MASSDGREDAHLTRTLLQAGYRFDFFQAVRLLTRLSRRHVLPGDEAMGGTPEEDRGVGRDLSPSLEPVRFRALQSLSFPTGAISEIRSPQREPGNAGRSMPVEMTVAFLGLTGPSGALPRHYTELILQRLREKDLALRDFLDLFNHRLISLFYRAWEKYHWVVTYENMRLRDSAAPSDPVTGALYCLDGLGTRGLRGRQDVDDELFLYFSGHFSHSPRSAIALESLLGEYLEMPVRVLQCQGQWLQLEPEDQALMPSPLVPKGRNNQLGINLVVGERVWDVQSRFRIRLGPLSWPQFRSLMPDGGALRPLCQIARFYAGSTLDLDVQPVLRGDEVPPCQLTPSPDDGPRLGWNTWMPFPELSTQSFVEDAVFQIDSL